MLEQLIKDLAIKDELSQEDWLAYSNVFNNIDNHQRNILIKALAAHSGLSNTDTSNALNSLKSDFSPEIHQQTLNNLQQLQHAASLKINNFKQHAYFSTVNTDSLALDRANWLAIIREFERQQRQHLTASFFIHTVSIIKRKPGPEIIDALSKHQPERKGKKRSYTDDIPAAKRIYSRYEEDGGVNPLILQIDEEHPNLDLESKIEATGARTAPLQPASPEKGYLYTARTPKGTKTRPVCSIGNRNFFKPISPYGEKGRVRLDPTKTQQAIHDALPQLITDRAEPVEYVATLEVINERAGLIRSQTQRSRMGASASDVFKAYGITIAPTQQRALHWGHLIAHFLGDTQNLTTANPDKPVLNLVPSTAAANYNILEAVELFIRKKLINQETTQIHIKVEPVYKDETLIPETLIYSMRWEENEQNCTEIFYINPQSHQRHTKSMYHSIEVLREERKIRNEAYDTNEDKDNTPSPK